MESSKKMFNAFISYSWVDGFDFVSQLRQKLANDNDGRLLKLWKDRDQMEGDKNWWKQITEAIDQSEYLILVITPKSLQSGTCQREWHYARQVGVCVRPVKGVLTNAIDYSLLPMSMRNAHIYDIDEEWRKFVNDLCRTCEARKIPFMAPPMPIDYVERRELFKTAKEILLESTSTRLALSTALKGAGGFGKTTLAAALCHDDEILEKFSDGILWANIGEEANLLKEISKMYHALTGKRENFEDEKEGSIILAEKLEQGNYLLVLDDVWQYTSIKELTERIKTSSLLITTRIDSVASQAKSSSCKVNEMKGTEGFQLLAGDWKLNEDEKNIVRSLVKDAGEWPLILKLMRRAALARIERGEVLSKTLVYLKEKYGRYGFEAFDTRNAKARDEAASRCIEASLSLLQPHEKKCCIQLGIFPTDTQIPIETICQLWGMEEFEGEDLMQLLDDFALLDLDLNKRIVQFHDVLLHYYAHNLGSALKDVNRQLLQGWHNIYKLPNNYAWQFYIWHLIKADEKQLAEDILQDYNWLKEKLEFGEINSLLLDFNLLHIKPKAVELIYKALRMSKHILVKDKSQLATQLHERTKLYWDGMSPSLLKNSLMKLTNRYSFL